MSRILVVDDCSSTRAFLKKVCWKWEIEVVACENATEALEALECPNAPRILFVDWMMPGMDGPDLIRRIRETETARHYIIMMTAKKETEDIEVGFAAGADDYMIKPLDQNEIRARLGEGEKVLFREEAIHQALGQFEA